MLRRGDEILVCHRVSTVPAFPDYWAFPGGGVSRTDASIEAALLREMVEEVGIAPDASGELFLVDADIQSAVNADKLAWRAYVEAGSLFDHTPGFDIISERTTPPLAPLRFHNRFFTARCAVDPRLPDIDRPEFDAWRWVKPRDLLDEWLAHEVRIPPPLVMLLRDLVAHDSLEAAVAALAAAPPTGTHRIEFAPGVECLPLPTATLPPATHTNCYFLGDVGGDFVVVDPAARCDEGLALLEDKVKRIQAGGGTIIATIFTHRHSDHIGDLGRISQMYTAPIWTHAETHKRIPPCETDRVLAEGDSFELNGVTWSVTETSGHCPGMLCLVSEAGIVSADNVVMVGTILVPSGEGDMRAYMADLARLDGLAPKLLFPGHGPVIANPTRLLNRYIRHRGARHAAVLEAVQGASSLDAIAKAAYADTPDAHPALKVDQTLAHLKALESEGRVVRSCDGHWSPAES